MIGADGSAWGMLLLLAAFVAQDTTAGPQLLFSEPLVGGALAGWIVGDVRLGLMIGLATQLVWSGSVPAGSTRFLDVNVATVCAVAVAASVPGERLLTAVAALVWAIPVGLLGSGLTELHRRVSDTIVSAVRPDADSLAIIAARHLSGWVLAGARGAVTVAAGTIAGVVVLPFIAGLFDPWARSELLWAGIFGAGGGMAIGVTWRFSRGKAAALGILTAAGIWALTTIAD